MRPIKSPLGSSSNSSSRAVAWATRRVQLRALRNADLATGAARAMLAGGSRSVRRTPSARRSKASRTRPSGSSADRIHAPSAAPRPRRPRRGRSPAPRASTARGAPGLAPRGPAPPKPPSLPPPPRPFDRAALARQDRHGSERRRHRWRGVVAQWHRGEPCSLKPAHSSAHSSSPRYLQGCQPQADSAEPAGALR